jgi:hypothetical protein
MGSTMTVGGIHYAPQEHLSLGAHPVIGFGQAEAVAPAATTSPWAVAIVTSIVSAAAGWALDEAAHHARKRRR